MSVIVELKRLWAGYPGGYKSTARGSDPEGRALPFRQPSDPNDIRSKLPALGHREYWYPALPDKDVGNAFCPLFRKRLIDPISTRVISMAGDRNIGFRIILKRLRKLSECILRFCT